MDSRGASFGWIAKRFGKALVIHDRDAHADILRVVDDEGAPDEVVMHCFSGDGEFAAQCLRRGFTLSFAGTVTFANAANLREAAALTPLDRMLVETDAPYLTPMPYRGRPNRPALVPVVGAAVAAARGVAAEVIEEATWANTGAVFRLPPVGSAGAGG